MNPQSFAPCSLVPALLGAVLACLTPSVAMALDDYGQKVTTDGAGNIYVTGASESVNGGLDYATIKYDRSGTRVWVRRYNGPANQDDIPYAIAVDGAGNVYVTGASAGVASGFDYATIKYGAGGQFRWLQRYNGPAGGSDEALALMLADGKVVVTGGSAGLGSGSDFATICYTAGGSRVWTRRYDGPAGFNDEARAIVFRAASGEVFVTGRSDGVNTGSDFATIKYTLAGRQRWVARYDGPGRDDDAANAIQLDPDGTVVVTGASAATTSGLDYATVKYRASTGNRVWVARYDGNASGSDEAFDLALDGATGDIYVTGASDGPNSGPDIVTIKYGKSGSQQWVKRYNGPAGQRDEGAAVRLDPAGNPCVAGFSSSVTSGRDYTTLKYNSRGTQLWIARYDGTGNRNDEAASIAVDAADNVIVTGALAARDTGFDFGTIVYGRSGALRRILSYDSP